MYFSNKTQTILLSEIVLSLKLEGFPLKLRKLRKEVRKTVILGLKDLGIISLKETKAKKENLEGISVKLSEENVLID